MFTNKKREGINRFVGDASLYVAKTPKASIRYHKPPLPIIPCGIVAYGFVGQPFSKQLYIRASREPGIGFDSLQPSRVSLSIDGRGLPRCKNLSSFSLFRSPCLPALYCFEVHCCLGRSLFYVAGEFHQFLHRG